MTQNFTCNSKYANANNTFVINKYNKPYVFTAKKNGCKKFIQSSELSRFYNFGAIKLIAITGTNGKTTTANIIGSLFGELGYKYAILGTNGFFVQNKQITPPTLTTPMQVDIFSNIQYAKNNGCSVFVMEVSSHAIEQNRIEGLEFDIKICTNITSDHLDYHKTLQNYINVKNSFLNDVSDDGLKLINGDDKTIKANNNNCFTYKLAKTDDVSYENDTKDNKNSNNKNSKITKPNSNYTINSINNNNDNNFFLNGKINVGNESVNFKSKFIGEFNLYNILASVACVHLISKINIKTICNKLKFVSTISGRMEVVNKTPLVIVDFAHTDDGFGQVFKNFKNFDRLKQKQANTNTNELNTTKTQNKLIAVFGAGGDRDKTKRAKMGQIANLYCDVIVLTNDNPRYEKPNDIINDIQKGITNCTSNKSSKSNKKTSKKQVSCDKHLFVQQDRKKAIKKAISLANDGDVVLVLGKGCEKYQTIKDKKLKFEDKKIILQVIQNKNKNELITNKTITTSKQNANSKRL